MKKLSFIILLFGIILIGESFLEASIARITSANFRSKINCKGKSLHKLQKKYGNICAGEQGTLALYTKIYIPKIKKTYTIIDFMPKSSTNKHKKRALKKGIALDLCIDRYLDIPTKQLRKYDLDITNIKVIK